MRATSTTEKNIIPGMNSQAPWRVTKVDPLEDYQLAVEFADGSQGRVIMRERVFNPNAGVFTQLKDAKLFNQVFNNHGVVTWPGEIDLAPDAMHAAIQKHGQWVLR